MTRKPVAHVKTTGCLSRITSTFRKALEKMRRTLTFFMASYVGGSLMLHGFPWRLFSFAEYPVAPGLRSRSGCFGGVGRYGDEGVENPPEPWRRRVAASENFARYPAASGLRSRSGYFGGVGCCGEIHVQNHQIQPKHAHRIKDHDVHIRAANLTMKEYIIQ